MPERIEIPDLFPSVRDVSAKRVVITGPGAEKSVAETVAALYDESLDAFAPHNWPHGFGVFYEDNSTAQAQFLNFGSQFARAFGVWNYRRENVEISYRHFPFYLTQNLF